MFEIGSYLSRFRRVTLAAMLVSAAIAAATADTPGTGTIAEAVQAFFAGNEVRHVGSAGNLAIEQRVLELFEASGLPTECVTFTAPGFVPGRASLTLPTGRTYRLHPLHPSLIRPGNPSERSFSARLVYLGKGSFEELAAVQGSNLEGALVVMDFDSGQNWLRFLRFGPKGFIFIGKEHYTTSEAQDKVHNSEVAVPRFFVSRDDGAELKAAMLAGGGPVVASMETAPSTWKNGAVRNVCVLIPGSDPDLARDVILITAPVDSNSVVPGLAQGARAGVNLYLLLELFEAFRKNPPPRSVMLAAINAHTHGFLGERMLAWHLLGSTEAVEDVRNTLGEEIARDQVLQAQYEEIELDPPGEQTEQLLIDFRILEDRTTGKTIQLKAPLVTLAKRDVNQVKGKLFDAQRSDLPETQKNEKLARLREQLDQHVNILTLFNKVGVKTQLSDLTPPEVDVLRSYVDALRNNFRQWTELNRRDLARDMGNDAVRQMLGGRTVRLAIALDMCFSGQQIGFCSSNIYSRTQWSQRLGANSVRVARELHPDDQQRLLLDTMTNYAGLSEGFYFPSVASSIGYFHATGVAAVSLKTAFHDTGEIFTPNDTFDRLEPEVLDRVVPYVKEFLATLFADASFTTSAELPSPRTRSALWATHAKAFKFDEFAASVVPEIPVPGTIVIGYPQGAASEVSFLNGDVINRFFLLTDERAAAMLYGLSSPWGMPALAFDFDEDFITVRHALDAGEAYERLSSTLERSPERTMVMFDCIEFPIHNLVDTSKVSFFPIKVETLLCLDASQDSAPRRYGMTGFRSGFSSKLMPHRPTGPGAFYFPPENSVKIITDTKRSVINADAEHPLGRGFDTPKAIGRDFFATATRDMAVLNSARLKRLSGVSDQLVQDFMERAATARERMLISGRKHQHLAYLKSLCEALGSQAKAYEQVTSVTNDMLKAVVFFMALLLPFCFFVQKLLFKFVRLEMQLAAFAVLFVATFLVFRQIHPAFKIAKAPEAIFIGFVMGMLGTFVIYILHHHFEGEMQLLFLTYSGLDTTEVGYSTVGQKAMMIGVNNMKRRRIRTALTTATIILVTFTMLAFSSISKKMYPTVVSVSRDAKYTGLFYHWPGGLRMDDATRDVFYQLFAGDAEEIVVRNWLLPPPEQHGLTPYPLRVSSAKDTDAQLDAVLGVPMSENGFLGPMPLLSGSRFFTADDAWEAVIPTGTASALKLGTADVGKVDLIFRGHRLRLIGIVDDQRLRAMRDLNNRPILPIVQIEQSLRQVDADASRVIDPTTEDETSIFYADTSALLILPVDTARKLGAMPFSVSVRFADDTPIWPAMDLLMTSTEAKFYISSRSPFTLGDQSQRSNFAGVYYIGSGYRTSIGGLTRLIIPLLIAGTIVLNTMLGSVYERKNEIAVYNAVGLNPTHIGLFFLAEAFVYSVIGSVGGYLIGQVLSLGITKFGLVEGINLNFSSLAVVYVIMFTIAVVLLSTLYPATVATRAAVPSGKRKWSLPDHDGQKMHIVFPFIYQPRLAVGIMGYINEYMARFTEASMGTLVAHLEACEKASDEHGRETYSLVYNVALAPFDLGVTQRVTFHTRYDDIVESYRVHTTIERISGQDTNWATTNKPFLEKLRQYLLHWRSLAPEVHDMLGERGTEVFTKAGIIPA